MDIELYTRERLHTAIERMRKSTEELNRVLAILNENNARTLKDDLENFENRIAGRRLNQAYVQAVCNAFYVTTKSKLHSALLEAVVAEPTSQKLLDNMIGKYEAYWPASNDKFDKFPMEISYADDTYTVSDRTIGKSKIQFGHSGFAFLIRKRVHVVEPVESGLRSMIFHYEEMPAKPCQRDHNEHIGRRIRGFESWGADLLRAFHCIPRERHHAFWTTDSAEAVK